MRNLALIVSFSILATTAYAEETPTIEFGWPVGCDVGKNCWIARYPDRYTSDEATDYRCNFRTQNGHDATDIIIGDISAIAKNIPVLAAADGVVSNVRDGLEDKILDPKDEDKISHVGCGNAVIIHHADGFQTHYCHMKKGSVKVEQGQAVQKGEPIGAVGLSGLTEFPHLHFMVRRKHETGLVSYDPFDSKPLTAACNANIEGQSLWQQAIDYQETALLPPLITDRRATRTTMWQAQPEDLKSSMRVMYFQARGFHTKEGDTWTLQLTAPDGSVFRDRSDAQYRSQQRVTIVLAVTRPSAGFAPGLWQATTSLSRGGTLLASQTTNFKIIR